MLPTDDAFCNEGPLEKASLRWASFVCPSGRAALLQQVLAKMLSVWVLHSSCLTIIPRPSVYILVWILLYVTAGCFAGPILKMNDEYRPAQNVFRRENYFNFGFLPVQPENTIMLLGEEFSTCKTYIKILTAVTAPSDSYWKCSSKSMALLLLESVKELDERSVNSRAKMTDFR